MKTAFVTGATGFIGRHLVRQLVDAGWVIHALARPTSDRSGLSDAVNWHVGDVTDRASVSTAVPPDPDAVFHVAADTAVWRGHRERQWAINVDGTTNVLDAAIDKRCKRFILTSSVSVFGFHEGVLSEISEPDVGAYWIGYHHSKAEAERRVMAASVDAVVLNPGHVVGPGDTENWARMIKMVDQDKLPGVPPGIGSFADVREVARAHVTAATLDNPAKRYILAGENASFVDVVRIIGSLLNQDTPERATPALILKAYARVLDLVSRVTKREPRVTPESIAMVCHDGSADSSKACAELGYRITPVAQLFADAVKWLQDEGLVGR